MRAFEIALFLVMIAAGFTIISSLEIFPADVVPVPAGMFAPYTVTELSKFPTSPGLIDYFFLMVTLIVNSILWAMTVLLTIVIFYPFLMSVLGIPAALAIPLNAGVWFVFVIAIVQIWRSQSIDIMR
jgi:hypothetical protein